MIAEGWREAQRILAVRLDNLGDVLLATPALRAIRESLPGAQLTLLSSAQGAQAGRLNPHLDDVIAYSAPWVDPWQQLPHDSARAQRAIDELRARRFDAAVIFSSYRQSALPAAYLCYLAGIPLRLAASDEASGSLLTTRHRHPRAASGAVPHEVLRNLALVGAVGFTSAADDLVLDVPPGACRMLDRRLPALPRSPLVVLHPGCSMPARTYPWQSFAAVAQLLVQRLGAGVVLTGMADERRLTAAIRMAVAPDARGNVHDLAGELPFEALCALIGRADAVVTNNTGPMHLAAALKTPVVAAFALTVPPEQWCPWRVPHRLLFRDVACRLCYERACPVGHACLRGVAPDDIVAALAELLAEAAVPTAGTPTTWDFHHETIA